MFRVILWIFLFIPISTFATDHFIQIFPLNPFPEKVAVSSNITAEFKVINISAISLEVVDKSDFPAKSGLSILSNECINRQLKHMEYCLIKLQLNAPNTPQTISTQLIETTSPTPDQNDTISYPIKIEITNVFTIKPIADTGGKISPSETQKIEEGNSLTFTALPNVNFKVKQRLVDDIVAQKGKDTYILSHITQNHTVKVTFSQEQAANNTIIIGGSNLSPDKHGSMMMISHDNGKSWGIKNTNNLPQDFDFSGLSCTGNGKNTTCISPYANNKIVLTNDAGETWAIKQLDMDFSSNDPHHTRCTGEENGIICIAGPLVKNQRYYMASSQDAGKNWQILRPNGFPDDPPDDPDDKHTTELSTASCTGSEKNAMCVLGGSNHYYIHVDEHYRTYPLAVFTNDGGKTWETSSPGYGMNSYAITSGCSRDNCFLGGYGQETNYYYALLMKGRFYPGGGYRPDDDFFQPSISTISCSKSQNPICFFGGEQITVFNDQEPSFYGNYVDSACSGNKQNGFCLVNESNSNVIEILGSEGESVETNGFYAMQCAGEDPKSFCTIFKKDNTLLFSSDGAKTWIETKVPSAGVKITAFQVIAE